MIRGRWIWDRTARELIPADEFYARKYSDVTASDLAAPMVIGDIKPYRSTIDGSEISGRRQHRDHLKAHGCVELGNEMPKPSGGPTRSPKAEVIADIKRSMEDEGLRAEAKAASLRAKRAVRG
jgi:hypothetical protein